MAKALIKAAYGREPDRSYIAGTSNGGRHAFVAAARYPTQYDGVLANSPGINLPRAASANLATVKLWDAAATTKVVNGQPDLESALPAADRRLVANSMLAKCDLLDGIADGMVQDVEACRSAFDINRDVPTCSAARDGTCLSSDQKAALVRAYSAARTTNGESVYSTFPFDPGLVQTGWADWKFRSSVGNTRNPVSMAYIFSSPPMTDVTMASDRTRTAAYAVGFNLDAEFPKIFATSGVYAESSMSFMTAPNPTKLDALRDRGAKLLVIHGLADGIFSADDTATWYRGLDAANEGKADRFARFFQVPGMGHSRGGPSTDQYDALTALVNWVEKGQAPDKIIASARGTGNVGGVNIELPADWSPTRTRPLCPYPSVARYRSGDKELESSFACSR
jgi:feruloyl esterase